MYGGDFQLLIDRLEACEAKPEAVAALSQFLGSAGIEHYAYLGFQAHSAYCPEPLKAGTYPAAWVDEYIENRLYAVDPVVLAATQSTLPLFWSGTRVPLILSAKSTAELFERAASHGIRAGYTIPIRSSIGQLATMTFASSLSDAEFSRLLKERQAELHLGAFHFHDAIERICAPARVAQLTPRERTCLSFSSQGLSAKEIARLLHLSPRSVKFHHDNARMKLGAANLKQAVNTANCLGLI